MLRSLFALGLALALAAPSVQAQGYGDPYGRPYDGLSAGSRAPSTGVRLGIGIGPYFYAGPDVLAGTSRRDNVVATNLGVTAEVSAPFTPQLYGRLMGGLLNIGADDSRADVVASTGGAPDARYNPYLTSQTILAEGNLLYYFTPPATAAVSPYVFSGLSGLFATGDAVSGINRSALAIPVGLGVEFRVARNLSLFAEGSYRFGLTPVASDVSLAMANSGPEDPGHCGTDPTKPECKPPTCDQDPTNPNCKPVSCHEDPTQPSCPPGVGNGNDASDRERFNSGLILGGLRLGFNPAPRPVVPPYIPPPVVEPPPVAPPPVRAVCDLVELNTLYFDYGSATLNPRARALLNENVELLLENPECCVFIDSYIDHAEQDQFGMPIGGRRAQAVYDYYLSRGVEAGRLQIRNRGVAEPNCDKEDPGPGCERNRRVESIPVDCERFLFLLQNPSYSPN